MDATRRIALCDTTLRDGEQAPGVSFSTADKVALAKLLDEAGVAEIEAGTPACGEGEREAIGAVAALGLKAEVTAWCRMREDDVEAAAACGVGAVALAVPSSDLHIRTKMRLERAVVLERMAACVRRARGLGLNVLAACEDAGRADVEFLARLANEAVVAGARRVRLSDTVGALDPFGAAALVEALGGVGVPLEFHAHNDFGLATANALAAARAGATHLSVTALGLGERAGNAALEETALALERLLGLRTGIRPEALLPLCVAVACLSGRPIAPGKPIVGASAFTHESGIHVRGVLEAPELYEPFPPEALGRTRSIVLGKHSGEAGVAHRLREVCDAPEQGAARRLLPQVKRLAAQKRGAVEPHELLALLARETTDEEAKKSS